ncbi:hypothetical protein A0J57_23470 [Sphingobium sp. 22B]|nr:hypothetical protein AXW74_22175 [Sphingobium sp. AM]KYC29878.1 hypothetical protein A0J57_23470 [Sphingobium sp. 22B]OAP31561.1 hypothetical protein A8O16_13280 [Sphingobium sp. 20006FA]
MIVLFYACQQHTQNSPCDQSEYQRSKNSAQSAGLKCAIGAARLNDALYISLLAAGFIASFLQCRHRRAELTVRKLTFQLKSLKLRGCGGQ